MGAMSTRPALERLERLERILAVIASQPLGVPTLGPMDPGHRAARQQAAEDVRQILAEQQQPPLETRRTA